jgi:hypothetical protein
MSTIDYSKLNDKIVKQAYSSSGFRIADLNKLYEAKVERAKAMLAARNTVLELKTIYHQIED